MAARFTVVLQTSAGATLAPAIRQVVREIDPELPLQVRRVEEAFDLALAGRRFSLTLIGVFGVTALLLATLGVYGLMSYLVAERTREIGVRLALGADVRDVLRRVMGRGVLLGLVGMAGGLAAALALTRFLEGLLFGVTAADPLALGGVLGTVLVAVILASYAPARRALQVAPVEAMRAE
jgi:ABC-type antimicrobial peptide transport system permease subunit